MAGEWLVVKSASGRAAGGPTAIMANFQGPWPAGRPSPLLPCPYGEAETDVHQGTERESQVGDRRAGERAPGAAVAWVRPNAVHAP